jgi:hypothetical protein
MWLVEGQIMTVETKFAEKRMFRNEWEQDWLNLPIRISVFKRCASWCRRGDLG